MKTCPFLKKPCIEEACMLWKPLSLESPQGQSEVKWDCSINWNIFLLIENAKQHRHTAGSIDKVANEMQAGAGTILMRLLQGQASKLERPE